jgi:hypothetical protein
LPAEWVRFCGVELEAFGEGLHRRVVYTFPQIYPDLRDAVEADHAEA